MTSALIIFLVLFKLSETEGPRFWNQMKDELGCCGVSFGETALLDELGCMLCLSSSEVACWLHSILFLARLLMGEFEFCLLK